MTAVTIRAIDMDNWHHELTQDQRDAILAWVTELIGPERADLTFAVTLADEGVVIVDHYATALARSKAVLALFDTSMPRWQHGADSWLWVRRRIHTRTPPPTWLPTRTPETHT